MCTNALQLEQFQHVLERIGITSDRSLTSSKYRFQHTVKLAKLLMETTPVLVGPESLPGKLALTACRGGFHNI